MEFAPPPDADLEAERIQAAEQLDRRGFHPVLPLALMAAGMLWIFVTQIIETRYRDTHFLGYGALTSGPKPEWEGAREVLSRTVPGTLLPRDHTIIKTLQSNSQTEDIVETIDRAMTERLLIVPLSEEELTSLVDRGRAPIPGKAEVLAGAMTMHAKQVCVDGVCFEVVGRIRRGVGGLNKSYVLPPDPKWQGLYVNQPEAKTYWLTPDGWIRLHEMSDQDVATAKIDPVSMFPPNLPGVTYSTAAAVVVVVLGWGFMQLQLLHLLAKTYAVVRPLARALDTRPALFAFVMAIHVGFWAVANIAAARSPIAQSVVLSTVSDIFTEGSLSHIGGAYAAGDIPRATATTFFHNCVLQTYLYTMLPGLVPVLGTLFALGKNLISFGVAGFALTPVWMGFSERLTLHSVTIALELNAYILAAFAVCAYAAEQWDGIAKGAFVERMIRGLSVMASCVVVVGVVLAIAAAYEAVTLIHF